jgi:hypothetical protein
MKPFHLKSIAFLFTPVMAICALMLPAAAEQPAVSPQEPAELKKVLVPPRAKPQVIYHISKADASALHAQAKSQTDALAVDSSMPTSLQMSRAAANEAAAAKAAAPPQPPAAPKESVAKTDPAKQTPKHFSVRAKESAQRKNSSPRNSHTPKSHKH